MVDKGKELKKKQRVENWRTHKKVNSITRKKGEKKERETHSLE